MLCEYKFPVAGRLRTAHGHDVTVGNCAVSFETNSTGRVIAVCVKVRIDERSDWPTITENPNGPEKWHLNVPAPAWESLREMLRRIEGLLALYGLDEINFAHVEHRWIPENAEEVAALDVHGLTVSTEERPDTDFPSIEFDVVARSVLASIDVIELEVPLSFFRKGRLDMLAQRYIEAYYDYFFVLETLFGDGKHRQDALAAAFASSDLLISTTRKVLNGEGIARLIANRPALIPRLNRQYVRASPADVLGSLIETRGFLHHHSSKRPNIWHPDKQAQFEIDAVIVEEIAFQVVWALCSPFVFSDEAVRRYRDMMRGKKGAEAP